MNITQKCSLPRVLVIHDAEHFREPVVPGRENGEHSTQREHIVEMGYHVIGIVQGAVEASIGQLYAG